MKKLSLSIVIFCFCLLINAQNNPPTLKAWSQTAPYGLQVCIDIETEDADGDSVFVGFITKIPQSQFTQTNSYKRFATGSVCLTTERGVHSDQQPNSMTVYATDKKDTTYKIISVTIPRYPHNVRPVINKLNYNTFRVDVKGDKNEPWGDYKGLRYESRVFDLNKKLLLKDTNQIFTFNAPAYEKYILYVTYLTSKPMLHASRDTLYPDMNVSVVSPQQNSFTIYPNPTTGNIFIKNLPQEVKSITLFDALGKEIKQLNTVSNSFSIESLPNGMYWVEVETLQGILGRQKIIKVD